MAEYYGSHETDELLRGLPDVAGLENTTPPFALVEFLNLKEGQIFDKVQCRKGGQARQVLKDAVIQMKATFSHAQLYHITGCVKREAEAARLVGPEIGKDMMLMKNENELMNLAENFVDVEHGAIPIPEMIGDQEYLTLRFYVDLEKIYSGPKHSMFQLVKTDIVARNKFQLKIQLNFLDRDPSEVFESPVFRCRTKKTKETNESMPPPKPAASEPPSPPAITSMHVITDTLTARTAQIDDLVARTFSTPSADIAYHLKINDDEIAAELEEGDVVGFFTDESNGGTYVKLLRSPDIDNAVHAGVVSRSYYLGANKNHDQDEKTETVCVIGMVNVKVVGSVENGERVYASISRPGKAIPQSHLPVGSFLRKKHALLGTAMERKSPKSLEDEHLVKCFVCIVLDVGRQDVLEEVEEIYELSEKSTREQIKFASKKTWKKLKCCFFSTILFVLLLAFLLYQVFVPGSMFRYWLCRRGSLTGDLWVTVTPYRAITEEINVHGIRFSYDGLRDKTDDHFSRNTRTGSKDVYYYLNLDRCAYFGDQGPVRDYISGKYKDIGGGKVLSINKNCSTIYWFGRHPNHTKAGLQWYPYISAQYLQCSPTPPFR